MDFAHSILIHTLLFYVISLLHSQIQKYAGGNQRSVHQHHAVSALDFQRYQGRDADQAALAGGLPPRQRLAPPMAPPGGGRRTAHLPVCTASSPVLLRMLALDPLALALAKGGAGGYTRAVKGKTYLLCYACRRYCGRYKKIRNPGGQLKVRNQYGTHGSWKCPSGPSPTNPMISVGGLRRALESSL